MKKIFLFILLLCLSSLSLLQFEHINHIQHSQSDTDAIMTISEPHSISLRLVNDNKTIDLNFDDYILGVVANEMPPDYNLEALKAQIVAVKSYVLNRLYYQNKNTIFDLHKGAILCNSSHCINWYPYENTIKKWDIEKTNAYKEKFRTALTETKGEYLTYNNIPALTFWHKISHGKTESSLDILGVDSPYHQSVLSESDKYAPGYISRVIYPKEAFVTIMSGLKGDTFNAENFSSDILGDTTYTSNGCITTIQIDNEIYSGQEIMNAFKLKSSFFSIRFEGTNVVFDVKGDGHCVGMSQFGANVMANKGSAYIDILYYYYPGISISTLNHIA